MYKRAESRNPPGQAPDTNELSFYVLTTWKKEAQACKHLQRTQNYKTDLVDPEKNQTELLERKNLEANKNLNRSVWQKIRNNRRDEKEPELRSQETA